MTTYAMDKLDAETVKLNFLPEDLSPSAIWGRMMLHIRETERQRKGNNEFKPLPRKRQRAGRWPTGSNSSMSSSTSLILST